MKRLAEELPEGFEASLLASEGGPEPSFEAQGRALDAAVKVIGAGVATAAGAASASGGAVGAGALTGKVAPVLAWKAWVAGVIVGSAALGAGGVLVVKSAREIPVAAPRAPAASESVSRPPVSKQPDRLPETAPEPVVVPAPEPARTVSPSERPDLKKGHAVDAPPAVSASPDIARASPENHLAGEVRAIDRARAALAVHHPGEAIAILDEYDHQFPSASLSREAALLRIEALSERGDRAEAVRLARELLTQSPEGPYRARLERVLGLEPPP
jgi:hypothetical protein